MGPHLYPRLGYDPMRDLIPVGQSCHVCNGIMARPDLPVATLKEALDLAKRRPGELVYGSPGNGTSGHLIGEYLNRNAGVTMQHVPYRGTAPMMTDLLGGRLDLVHDNLPGYLPAIRDGKAKLLAVTSPQPWFAAPGTPTVGEAADLPGFSAMIWWGVQVPTGTPEPIQDRLSAAMVAGFSGTEARDRLHQLGIEPAPLDRAAFTAHVAAEYRKWGEVVRQAGIRVD
jgi:tripartite-type tricarboxylate transporter receptor subunit TctC